MSIRRKPRPSRVRVGPAALVLGALMLAGCGSGGADGARQRPSNNFSPAPSAPGAPVPGTSVQRSFGLDIHDPMNHWPSQPFGFIRLWDANVEWAHIAPSRGVFDFSRLDQYVSQAEKHHVEIIYVMGNTPWWAATDPNSKSNENIPGANSSPTNLQDWQDYVRAVVTRYQGRIQAYEIWNEANLAGYWTGSMETMLQMVQMAYATIKEVDPQATVLAPSVVGSTGADWTNQFFRAGGNQYSDGIAFHPYNTNPVPEAVVPYYQNALRLGQQWSKAVWNTEFGWGPWGTFDATMQASMLARMLILQAAAGFTKIGWYAWDDRGGWVHLYLVEADMHTPTLAGQAFGEVQKWLGDSTIGCSSDSGVWQCELVAPDGGRKYIVWNPAATETFFIPSAWNVSQMRDLRGGITSISGAQVQIGALPVLLEP